MCFIGLMLDLLHAFLHGTLKFDRLTVPGEPMNKVKTKYHCYLTPELLYNTGNYTSQMSVVMRTAN